MTDTTNTSAAHAAALAMRDAAVALARRRPLYDGASGEPADEDLAQAIEDLPLPDVGTTDWRVEAERLRGLLSREQQERHAMLGRTDAALAALAQAREMLIGDPHLYRGQCPQPDDTDARDPECPACAALVRIDAALAAKGE